MSVFRFSYQVAVVGFEPPTFWLPGGRFTTRPPCPPLINIRNSEEAVLLFFLNLFYLSWIYTRISKIASLHRVPQYSPRLLWPRGVLWTEYCLWGVSYFYYPTLSSSLHYSAMVFISWWEGSIASGILPTPNTSLSSLPVGSKHLNRSKWYQVLLCLVVNPLYIACLVFICSFEGISEKKEILNPRKGNS